MDNHLVLIGSLSVLLSLTACGGSSGDDPQNPADQVDPSFEETPAIVPVFPVPPTPPLPPEPEATPNLFPAFTVDHRSEFTFIEGVDYDPEIDTEQVIIVAGIPVRENASGSINSLYETYCEISYTPISAETADDAYLLLTGGAGNTVFAFENDIPNVNFTTINAIAQDNRVGREYTYFINVEDSIVNGQGRAFYFDADNDNLTRSAMLYFECFGYADEFFDNTVIITEHLDSIRFNLSTNTMPLDGRDQSTQHSSVDVSGDAIVRANIF